MRPRVVLALVVLVVLASAAWWFSRRARDASVNRLEATLARRAAEGMAVRWEDLLEGVGRLDDGRQRAVAAWGKSPISQSAGQAAADVFGLLDASAAQVARATAAVESERALAEALLAVLRQGPTCLTSAGLTPGLAAGKVKGVPGLRLEIPQMIYVREVTCWAALRAATAKDASSAASALSDLDLVVDSFRPFFLLVDALIALRLEAIREDVYGYLALHGRLDEARQRAWIEARPRHFDTVADGLRGELLLVIVPIARVLAAGEDLPPELGKPRWQWSPYWVWRDHVARRWLAVEEGADLIEAETAFERWLRTGRGGEQAASAPAFLRNLGWPWEMVLVNHPAIAQAVAMYDLRFRSLRLAALLAASARGGAGLPKDDAEARARLGERASWLAASSRGYALRYDRLADDAFRVAVDPATAVPAPCGFPGGRYPAADAPPPVSPTAAVSPGPRPAEPRWRPSWGVRAVVR